MHESIAKAVRRGENRRIAVRASGYWDRVVALHDEPSRRPVPMVPAARNGRGPSPVPRGGGVAPLLRAAPPH